MWECPDFYAVNDATGKPSGSYVLKASAGGDWWTVGKWVQTSDDSKPDSFVTACKNDIHDDNQKYDQGTSEDYTDWPTDYYNFVTGASCQPGPLAAESREGAIVTAHNGFEEALFEAEVLDIVGQGGGRPQRLIDFEQLRKPVWKPPATQTAATERPPRCCRCSFSIFWPTPESTEKTASVAPRAFSCTSETVATATPQHAVTRSAALPKGSAFA